MADAFLDNLIEMSREASEAHGEWTTLKEQTKEAKDRYDGLMESILFKLKKYREETGPDRLPFGDDDSGGGGGDDGDGPDQPAPRPPANGDVIDVEFGPVQPALPAPTIAPNVIAPPLSDESWRAEPIGNLIRFGLTAKTVELLADAKITTVGAMADFSRAGNDLTDIPGIGEAKTDEINQAFDAFWIDYQRQQAPRAESEPAPKKSRKKSA